MEESHQHSLPLSGQPTTRGNGPGGLAISGVARAAGAVLLDPDASEGRRGFLLNHLISELLPETGDGYRYSNSDPLTGQAAWFDLRVRVEKASVQEADELSPIFTPTTRPPNLASTTPVLRYGAKFREAREKGGLS